MKIDPGSSAMLPLTFFPQVPTYQSVHTESDYEVEERISSISREAAIDLGDVLDIEPAEIGRNQLHFAQADILIKTSRGNVMETIHTSARRKNSYSLPHTIIFEQDGYVSTDSIFDHNNRDIFRNSKNRGDIAYEYDLYIDNPSNEEFLSLVDIYPSNPEYVTIDFAHLGGRQDLTDFNSSDRFNNCGFNKLEMTHCNYPMTSELQGPLQMKPGGTRGYVGTVKLNRGLFKNGGGLEHVKKLSLGYVNMRVGEDYLSVAVDFIAESIGDTHQKGPNEDKIKENSDASTNQIVGLKPSSTLSTIQSKLIYSKEVQERCDLARDSVYKVVAEAEQHSVNDATDLTMVQIPLNESAIPTIDFGLMTSLGEKKIIAVSVTNVGNFSIRMMHQNIDFAIGPKASPGTITWYDRTFDKNSYLESSRTGVISRDFNTSQIIYPGETMNDVVKVSMKSDFIDGNEGKAKFDGSVILRFGRADLTIDEWKDFVMNDPFDAQDLAIELPLSVSMLQGRVTYDASKAYFPALRQDVDSSDAPKDCGASFDRKIQITNDFAVPLTLRNINIRRDYKVEHDELPSAICNDHFDLLGVDGDDFTAEPGESWMDISIRYKYLGTSHETLTSINETKKCTLVLGTDLAGDFHIPLYIYKGSVVVLPQESAALEECQGSKPLAGLDCVEAMKDKSTMGAIIGETIRQHTGRGRKEKFGISYREEWVRQIGSYFSSLTNNAKRKQMSLEPVILSFGIMSAGAIKTHSFFIKNNNPIPIDITALVAATEGMEVRLGRVGAHVDDYIQSVAQDGESSLKTYLSDVESPSRKFLQKFSHRDDISLMPSASQTMKYIYHNTATIKMYRGSWNNEERPNGGQQQEHPPIFMHETFPEDSMVTSPSPSLIDLDHGITYPLQTSMDDSSKVWSVPPGGIARFEVVVRSPTKRALNNQEMAEILATGLALKTNFGQLLPIVVTYKMLSGNLRVTGSNEIPGPSRGKKLLPIPGIFRSKKDGASNSPVRIKIENTFSSSVVLRNIKSCNKWFEVGIHDSKQTLPNLMTTNSNLTASIVTNLSCQSETSGPFPSFYHCALEWLEKRRTIEENRCTVYSDGDDPWANHTLAKANAINDMKVAVEYMDKKYGTSEENHQSMTSLHNQKKILSSFNLAKAKSLAQNWELLSSHGLNTVRGAIHAQFELVNEDRTKKGQSSSPFSGNSPSITTVFPSEILQTNLEFPYLSERKIEFSPTMVGTVNELFFPINNPSGYPVRVKISSDSAFYLRTKKSSNPWWNGGSYWIPDDRGFLVRSHHNVTIRTPNGSSLSMLSPSLHATTALYHGCSGRRCGNIFPADNSKVQLHEENRMLGPIGASSALGAHLKGHSYNTDGQPVRVKVNSTGNFVDYFAMDQDITKEITVPPYSSVQMGPIYFRPPSRGFYSAILAVENTLTGYESLKVQGAGVMGKIVFFDDDEKENKGSDIELRHGRSSLIFRSADTDSNHRVVKTIMVGNVGDSPVTVKNIYLRAPKASQGFHGPPSNYCVQRGFRILECDPSTGLAYSGKGNIVLKKDKSALLHIAYQHDCTFQSTHAEIIVEHESIAGGFTVSSAELLLIYEMDEGEFRKCGNLPFVFGEEQTTSANTALALNFFTIVFPAIMFCFLLYDMISAAKQKQKSSATFQDLICASPKKQSKRKKTGFKNWSSAYRCLSRADPNSAELIQLRREQSRQMLLNTYRKEGMIQPQCVKSNGAFIRERLGPSSSNTGKSEASRRPPSATSITLNDAIFSNCNLLDIVDGSGFLPVIPGGLGWKVITSMHANQKPEHRSANIRTKTEKLEVGNSSKQRFLHLQSNVESRGCDSMVSNKFKSRKEISEAEKMPDKENRTSPCTTKDPPQSAERSISSLAAVKSIDENKNADAICPATIKQDGKRLQVATEFEATTDLLVDGVDDDICRNIETSDDEKVLHISSREMEPSAVVGGEAVRRSKGIAREPMKLEKQQPADAMLSKSEPESESKAQNPQTTSANSHKSRTPEIPRATIEVVKNKADSEKEMTNIGKCRQKGSADAKMDYYSKEEQESPSTPSRKKFSHKGKQSFKREEKGAVDPGDKSPSKKVKGKEMKKLSNISTATTPPPTADICENSYQNINPLKPNKSKIKMNDKRMTNKDDDAVSLSDSGAQSMGSPTRKSEKSKRRKRNKKNRTHDNKKLANETDTESKRDDENYSKYSASEDIKQRSNSPGVSIRTFSSEPKSSSNRTLVSSEGSEESSLATMISISPTPEVGKSHFRPPPGLAPPPGFASEDFTSTSSDYQGQDLPALPFVDASNNSLFNNNSDNGKGHNDGTSLLAKLLDENNALSLQPLEEEVPVENPLIEVGQDMNVMNFLTFLDESMDKSNGEDEGNYEHQVQEDNNYEALPLYGGLSAGVGNNPWSDARTPRAFTYGFEVEQGSDGESIDGDVVDTSLLTPGLILGHNGGDSDTERENGGAFDADAFFSDLLE